MRNELTIVGIACLAGIFCLIFPHIYRADLPRGSIVNNLRQLNAAKQQWLLDKKPSSDTWPIKTNLMLYFGPREAASFDQCVPPVAGEIYIINRADRPVEVYLTKDIFPFKEGQLLTIDDISNPRPKH
jgi:hypothetical protein